MKRPLSLFSLCLAIGVLLSLTACHKTHNDGPSDGDQQITTTWTKVASLPATEKFLVLETFNNTIYAASASGVVYISADQGATWQPTTIVKQGTMITALAVFNTKIYVGTYTDGIFVSANNGQTWANQSTAAEITSFTIWGNNLYASTADGSAPSNGVLSLSPATNTWSSFNSNGLPSNYDFSVAKTIVCNNTLVSIRGVNGYFYTFNTTTSQWTWVAYIPVYYSITMQDLVANQGTLLASSSNKLMSSTNFGATWVIDTVGLKNNINTSFTPKVKVLFSNEQKFYVLSNMPSGGTWVQERNASAAAGTSWANADQEFLSISGVTYAMRELNQTLFIATDNGLYTKKE